MNRPSSNKTPSLDEVHGEHAEDYERDSQEGEKDASKYPFGEKILGQGINTETPRKGHDSLTPKWAKNSPLSLETLQRSNMIINLTNYLDKSRSEKRELIKEQEDIGSKSILDETNILM